MGRSWSHAARLKDRVRACRWRFVPVTYKVRIDDTREQLAIRLANFHTGSGTIPEYLLWCAEYVLRHHKMLKGVRAELRKLDKEDRADKRRREAERKESEARWDAAPRKRPEGGAE